MFCERCDDTYCEGCALKKDSGFEVIEEDTKDGVERRILCKQCHLFTQTQTMKRRPKSPPRECVTCHEEKSQRIKFVLCFGCSQYYHATNCYNQDYRSKKQVLC